jgi:hypothetical protein
LRPTTPTSAQTYLNLALFAFALVGFELVLLAIERALGLPPEGFSSQIIHWALTIFVWVGGAVGFGIWARRRTDFRLRGNAEIRISGVRWLSAAGLVVVTLIAQWSLRGGAFPPVAEQNALVERFGDVGMVAWLVQIAYYFAELLVMVLIVLFVL